MPRFTSRNDLRALVAEHVRTYAATPQDAPHHERLIDELTEWGWRERGWRSTDDIRWPSLSTRLAQLLNALEQEPTP